MSENEIRDQEDNLEQDDGIELARKMAEEEEGIGRRPKGPSRYVIPTIAVAWSFFSFPLQAG